MQPLMFKGVEDYGRADIARKYRSTAGTQQEVDPVLVDHLMEQVQRDGFVVIEGLFEREQMEEIRRDLMPRFAPTGRNNFEGLKTQRLYALIEKTLSTNPLAEHPLILALLDRILAPNYLLSQLQAINILPGEVAQPIHADDSFYPWPRPRPPLGAATIWAVDDFHASNGATVVLPGSHLWDGHSPTPEELTRRQAVEMPAGSVVFFVGTLWHSGGANTSAASRLAITAQYCAPWCRQQENFSLSVSRARLKECSEHMLRMLGYSIYPPFIGFVNGMHPKRLLED